MSAPQFVKKRVLQGLLWVCVALWMGLIFCLSSQTAVESSSLSGGFVKEIATVLTPDFQKYPSAKQDTIIEAWQYVARKCAHASLFGILGVLTTLAMNVTEMRKKRLLILISIGICLFYAMSDEFHQIFIPGRSPQITDVGIDFCGAIVGIGLTTLLIWVIRGKKQRKTKCKV